MQEAAAQDEPIALVDLDRIMTRIRATEAKLALLSSRSPAANRLRAVRLHVVRRSTHSALVTA